jgi:HD-like signal output (HDOD) protein
MAFDLTPEQIRALLQGISIPPQPQIMVDLQLEQLTPGCDINRIAALIRQDVGLSGSILKTVNSSFFGLKNKIASVQQACQLLGIGSVVNIVNALSIRGELSDEDIVGLGRFWDPATDVAMVAAIIAKQIGAQSGDEAYTLGLFHNCGIPLLMRRFPEYAAVVRESYAHSQQRIIDTENRLLQTNHAVVGYYVAKSWNLPGYVCEAIHDHHSAQVIFADQDYANSQKKNLLAILKMAEHICASYRTLGGQAIDYEWRELEADVLMYVGLSAYDFQQLSEGVMELGLGQSGWPEGPAGWSKSSGDYISV